MKGFKKEKTIGIVGYGFLGQAYEFAFQPTCHIMINDIAYDVDNKKFFSKFDIVEKADVIFLGIPTPYSLSKGYIPNILDKVLEELNIAAVALKKEPIVIIKSAILPSHVKRIVKQFKHLDIIISPEYLSAKNTIGDAIYSNIHIFGGRKTSCEKVIDIILNHSILKTTWNAPKVAICSAIDASLIKYMENCFLAMKCNFMSEFYMLHEEVKTEDSVDFNEMIRLWQFDERMGEYPYKIPYEGEISFSSGCLDKDTRAIRDEFDANNVPYILGKANLDCQMEYRKDLPDPLWRGKVNGSELLD